MTWAILVINIKGGTGKSTVAQQLSSQLNDEGYDVGILDADIDSANLSSRLGVDEKITFKGDHTVEPVTTEDGMKLYSMENAFNDAAFSQSGTFMKQAVGSMINNSDWGHLDYMIVDCPPGSSDIFEELIRALRPSILGAISVGISDAVSDTARLVKVSSHNWLPIIGFIENMSGITCGDGLVECKGTDGDNITVEPFGSGDIERFVEKVDGNYLGSIPIATGGVELYDAAPDTFDNMIDSIEREAANGGPEIPEDNIGDKSFIKNVWNIVKNGIDRMNNDINIEEIQDKFGVQGREPLSIEIELTDASGLSKVLSKVILNVDNGELNAMSPRRAKRHGIEPEAGIKITSQHMYNAISGEKTVMHSPTGAVHTEPYSIIDAVKMGDAEVWGDKIINRLSVLDRILTQAVDMAQVREIVEKA